MTQMTQIANTVTMTSLELVDFINSVRGEGEAELQHKDFLAKVPKVLGVETSAKFSADLPDSYGRPRRGYRFPKRESCLMAMSYSYELQAAVFDHMTKLEEALSKAVSIPDFSDPVAAARAWADAKERELQAAQQLALAAPKVAFVDQYVENTGSMSFRQVAKLLKANERKLRQMLLDKGVMYYLGGVLTPYQPHIDAGRFEMKTGTSERNSHAFTQSRFTPKGIQWIAGLWASYEMESAA
ncbi:phage antirepressor KilAC domain-containing protein [Azotobacter vinelandii]|uniref:phage antirepressor KilAC domain-containing protein n=1 Tax=Azotobacter vinelandii TaxID=354 RepID=UPI002666597F|nr:phage antirepressor KilAC domain-containing protein [Azotobacter vinelandii]WKN20842.1 phage antirepressor KilAC domain-containing protein [Azotobacter vinelandii]